VLPHHSIFSVKATPTHKATTLQGTVCEFNHSSPDYDWGVNSASIFSHLSQCEPDLGSLFSDVWNQIPFLFVSIHLLCLYILYLKICFECTVDDTITYNGTLIKTRHFCYWYQNRMIFVWNTMNSDLLQNTNIKNCLILNKLRKDKKNVPVIYYWYLYFISLLVILLSNYRVGRLTFLSQKTFKTMREKLLSAVFLNSRAAVSQR
jgi:hypothetical protein